jgi:myo-inositol-1(or 4)-monophosphatase
MRDLRLSQFAQQLARGAGEELKKQFYSPTRGQVTRTGANPQTLADILSNAVIQKTIRRHFPGHEIKSEEADDRPVFGWDYESDYVWIVDPCDGTVNFISGIPFFSVSIALAYKLELVLGVVFDPIRNEMFSAERTKGATLNGVPISVAMNKSLEDATLGIDVAHDVSLIIQEIELLHILADKVRAVRSFYSGALELCYVACGRIDVRIDDSYKPWDVAAGSLIASEAGARVTDLGNMRWTLKARSILAANPTLHQLVTDLLEKRGNRREGREPWALQ